MKPVKLFFSYSHRDEKLRDKLALHLSLLQRQGVIKSWHDRKISAGSEWAQAIDDNFNAAEIILLLISDHFLASDYCYDIEMKQAIARHEAGEARVIPIILKPVDWNSAPFGKLQAFPKNAKPVTVWSNRDEAFLDITQGIRQAAREMAKVLGDRPTATTLDIAPQGTELSTAQLTDPADGLPPDVLAIPQTVLNLLAMEDLGGQVPLESAFYINRTPAQERCYEAIAKPGALIRIKAPRQMGKSSLMLRVLNYASRQGYPVAALNFQMAEQEVLSNLDQFLRWFCTSITWELGLEDRLEEYWKSNLGSKNKCTNYFQRYLLETLKYPLAICLDEVDQVFVHPAIATDFLGMLRAWHENAKLKPIWNNLRLVITHSEEVYVPLNINQSPFNVGLPIELPPLNRAQIEDLIQRHGLCWVESEVEQLMAIVGGHPFLARVALQQIARGELTLAQFLRVAPTQAGPFGSHLRRHLGNLQERNLVDAMKQVVAAKQPAIAQASKLANLGLVRFQGNNVVPLCDLYRQYFRDVLK